MSTAVAISLVGTQAADGGKSIYGDPPSLCKDVADMAKFCNTLPDEALTSEYIAEANNPEDLSGLQIRILQGISCKHSNMISDCDMKYRFDQSCLSEAVSIPIRKARFRAKAMKKFRRKILPYIVKETCITTNTLEETYTVENSALANSRVLSELGVDRLPQADDLVENDPSDDFVLKGDLQIDEDYSVEKQTEVSDSEELVIEEITSEIPVEDGYDSVVYDEYVPGDVLVYLDTSDVEIVIDGTQNNDMPTTASENIPVENNEATDMDVVGELSRSPRKPGEDTHQVIHNESMYESEDPLGDSDEQPAENPHDSGSPCIFSHVDDIHEHVGEPVATVDAHQDYQEVKGDNGNNIEASGKHIEGSKSKALDKKCSSRPAAVIISSDDDGRAVTDNTRDIHVKDDNNNTAMDTRVNQIHSDTSSFGVTAKLHGDVNQKPSAIPGVHRRKQSKQKTADKTKQDRLEKKHTKRVIRLDEQPASNPDLLGNILAGITGLSEDQGIRPGKAAKGTSPKHANDVSVAMDLDESMELLPGGETAFPVVGSHINQYGQDFNQRIPVIGTHLPQDDSFSIASYISDAPWNDNMAMPRYMQQNNIPPPGCTNLVPLSTHSVCNNVGVSMFDSMPPLLHSFVGNMPPPPPPPPPLPEPQIPDVNYVALPPSFQDEAFPSIIERLENQDLSQEGLAANENNDRCQKDAEEVDSTHVKVLDILKRTQSSLQNEPDSALIQSAIDLLSSKSKAEFSSNTNQNRHSLSNTTNEHFKHKDICNPKTSLKLDLPTPDAVKEDKPNNLPNTTKPSTAGKFHGRTLLQGKSVPPRIIPLDPLYLKKPLTSRGTLQVIPVDPRLELVKSHKALPAKNGFTHGKSAKNTDSNYKLIVICRAPVGLNRKLTKEPEEPLMRPKDIDRLLDELLIKSSRKDAPNSMSNRNHNRNESQEQPRKSMAEFYNPKDSLRGSVTSRCSVAERLQRIQSSESHKNIIPMNKVSHGKRSDEPAKPQVKAPPVFPAKLDQCDYSSKKNLAVLDNICGTLSSTVATTDDDDYLPQSSMEKRTSEMPVSRQDMYLPSGIPDLADTPSPISVTSSLDLDDEPTEREVTAPAKSAVVNSDCEEGELQDTPNSTILTFDFPDESAKMKRKHYHKKHNKSSMKDRSTPPRVTTQLNTSDVSSDSLNELDWELPKTKRSCKSPSVLTDNCMNKPDFSSKAAGSMLERRYAEEDRYHEDSSSRMSRQDYYGEGTHPECPIVLSRSPSPLATKYGATLRENSRGSSDRARHYWRHSCSRSPPVSIRHRQRHSRSPRRLHNGRSRSRSITRSSSHREPSPGSRTSSRESSPARASGRRSGSPPRERRSPTKAVYPYGSGWRMPTSIHDEDQRYRELMKRADLCRQGIVDHSDSRLLQSVNTSPADDWTLPSSRHRDKRHRKHTSTRNHSSRHADISSSGRRAVTGILFDITQRRFQSRGSEPYDPAVPTETEYSQITSIHSRLGPSSSVGIMSSRDLRNNIKTKDLREKILRP